MKIKDEKFWKKVIRSNSSTACWPWTGAQDREGYGRVVRVQFSKTALKTHRYAFYLHHGRWPEGDCRHACDNKACLRPDHLYDDARLAQRGKPVMQGYFENLEQQIKKRYVKGSRINGASALAKEYGLDAKLIRRIVEGRI